MNNWRKITKEELIQENKELKKKYENAVANYELEKYKNIKAIEIIESYNLGKYDYSIPPGGIIELLEILGGNDNEK